MKKRTMLIVIWACALLAVLAVARYCLFSTAWGFTNATLHCSMNGKSVETVLADEDWDALASALNFKLMEENIYRCTVGDELCVSVDGGTDFYIAQDGCSLVGVSDGGRCIRVEGDDAETVKTILQKYGVNL